MALRHSRQQSLLTNGSTLFLGEVDGRSAIARRFGDLVSEHEAERSGRGAMGSVQRQAVRAYATLCIERKRIETKMAAGETINAETYGQLCDRMDRQGRRMGNPKASAPKTLRAHLTAGASR
jgi:hypothetical protein